MMNGSLALLLTTPALRSHPTPPLARPPPAALARPPCLPTTSTNPKLRFLSCLLTQQPTRSPLTTSAAISKSSARSPPSLLKLPSRLPPGKPFSSACLNKTKLMVNFLLFLERLLSAPLNSNTTPLSPVHAFAATPSRARRSACGAASGRRAAGRAAVPQRGWILPSPRPSALAGSFSITSAG